MIRRIRLAMALITGTPIARPAHIDTNESLDGSIRLYFQIKQWSLRSN